MLRHFESWLDSVLTEEPPPEGLAAGLLAALKDGETVPAREGQTHLYSLWSAMTGLTQEVKIQSRTFRQLYDTLGPRRTLLGLCGCSAGKESVGPAARFARPSQPGLDTAREAPRALLQRRDVPCCNRCWRGPT